MRSRGGVHQGKTGVSYTKDVTRETQGRIVLRNLCTLVIYFGVKVLKVCDSCLVSMNLTAFKSL